MDIRYGDPRIARQFWAKIEEDPGSGCWLYFGTHTPTGWPTHSGKSVWRYLYAMLVGPVPPAVTMTCDMSPKECVNPYHRLSPYGGVTAPHLCAACGKLHTPE